MKKYVFITIIFTTILILGSCDYLDVVPDNIATIDYAFQNKREAEKFLFTCYSFRPPIGAIDIDPAMNGCDETWQLYVDLPGGIYRRNWTNSRIAFGNQTSTAPLLNFWDGENGGTSLWVGIRDCNIFLESINKVPDLTDYERKRWTAEVKFLKAYYHYYLLKCYGPIPIMDTNLPISAGVNEVKVYREPIDKVVKYITDLMAEAASDLPNVKEMIEGTEAGRVDKLTALSMRAEVLLFAASPLFNGNRDYANIIDNRGEHLFPETYDENKWKAAADACKQAIETCHAQGKELYDLIDPLVANAPDPLKLQTTYRQAICDRWNKELIWGSTNYDFYYLMRNEMCKVVPLPPDRTIDAIAQWAPTLKTIEKYYSSNGVPIEEDIHWQNNGWYENRYKIRPEPSSGDEKYYVKEGEKTVYLHYNREPRFYANIGFDRGIYFGNGYYDFPSNVKYCDFTYLGVSGAANNSSGTYSCTGYSVKKCHSFKNSQTTYATSYEYFPFPIMRLADLYLMYAEALNEFSGPTDEVFNYLDKVRTRAGLNGVKTSWQNYSSTPNKPNTKEGLREIIHQERTIELAFEGKRFWDLRRWKQINDLNDQPRGWSVLADTQEDFYKVVPVAKKPVKFSVKDYFWPIKEQDLIVNTNLIQNYGW